MSFYCFSLIDNIAIERHDFTVLLRSNEHFFLNSDIYLWAHGRLVDNVCAVDLFIFFNSNRFVHFEILYFNVGTFSRSAVLFCTE